MPDDSHEARRVMDVDEKYFALLLSDKQLADAAIGGYADLGLKVIGLFGAGIVLLGWLYSDKSSVSLTTGTPSTSAGTVCLALAVVTCGIIVQGVMTYALSLGYIQYKNEVLNGEFARLLHLAEPPLKAVPTWAQGEARLPTTLAGVALFVLHLAVAIVLLIVAQWNLQRDWWGSYLLVFGWCFLLVTVLTELSLVRAMKKVLLRK